MKHLPGLPVIKADVFNLKVGTRVFDKNSGKTGMISDIRETGYEVIEAFIQLDGETKETAAWLMPQTVIVGGGFV